MTKILTLPECLACPIDGLMLTLFSRDGYNLQLKCTNGHAFDMARKGYINLLGVQDKRSKEPGDTKAMIMARHRILSADLYKPIAETLSIQVNRLIDLSVNLKTNKQHIPIFTLLDAGCGEGYYLQYCLEQSDKRVALRGIGMDISKWAIQAAAKRSSAITWLVGSNRKPPLVSGSVDAVICGFGFPDFSAFRKIVKPMGYVIMLDPGENHLLELRKIIYPSLKPYRKQDFVKVLDMGGKVISVNNLTYQINVNRDQVSDILTMSPHLYRASAEGKMAVNNIDNLLLTVDVNYSLIQF